MPRAASRSGSACTRTANFWEPKIRTCATPVMVDSRWASMVSAYSLTTDNGRVGEDIAIKKIGESAGLDLRNEGGDGMSAGNWRSAVAMAVCTSCAAASMSRSSVNCRVIEVEP